MGPVGGQVQSSEQVTSSRFSEHGRVGSGQASGSDGFRLGGKGFPLH